MSASNIDIAQLVDAFRAQEQEKVDAANAKKREASRKFEEIKAFKIARLEELWPKVYEIVLLARKHNLPFSIFGLTVVRNAVHIHLCYKIPRHPVGFYDVDLRIHVSDKQPEDGTTLFNVTGGNNGGFLNAHLWQDNLDTASVLVLLAEFVGKAIVKGEFQSLERPIKH